MPEAASRVIEGRDVDIRMGDPSIGCAIGRTGPYERIRRVVSAVIDRTTALRYHPIGLFPTGTLGRGVAQLGSAYRSGR